MKKLIIALVAVASFAFATMEFNLTDPAVPTGNPGEYTVDITLNTGGVELAGWQFQLLSTIPGYSLVSVEGSLPLTDGFMWSANEAGLILGFSMLGFSLNTSSDEVFFTATYTCDDLAGDLYLTLEGGNLADPDALPITDYDMGTPLANEEMQSDKFALSGNYPNPFNPTTSIDFSVAAAGDVNIVIFDMLGREVATLVSSFHTPGSYSVTWDGHDSEGQLVASGMYHYAMKAGNFTERRTMTFMK